MAELTATPISPASDSTEERERRLSYAPSLALTRARSQKRESETDQQEVKATEEKEHQLDVLA